MGSSAMDATIAIAWRGAFVYRPRVLPPRWSCPLLTIAVLGAGLLGTTSAHAHFILTSPPAVSEQGPLGDPQKAPPCGDDGSAVATGALTPFQGGDVVTVTIDETIFHPGHYRIALAVNDISELPEEPLVTPNDTPCGTTPIQNPPVFPVLADGVFLHDQPFDQPQSIDIVLPADINCDNCTLQVIQFMSNHGLNNPGGCFYHHCANISVQSGSGTSTGAGESGSEGTAGTNATSVTTTATTTASSQGETAGNESTAGDAGGATADVPTSGTAATSEGATSTDGATSDSGGCGCSGASGGQGPATLALLGLLALGARRKPRAQR